MIVGMYLACTVMHIYIPYVVIILKFQVQIALDLYFIKSKEMNLIYILSKPLYIIICGNNKTFYRPELQFFIHISGQHAN